MTMIYIPAALPTTDNIDWVVIDRYGQEHNLSWFNNQSIFVPKGTRGLGYANVELTVEKRPNSRGSAVRHIATQPVEISLPLVITANTFKQCLINVEQVKDWFFTGDERSKTPGYLKIGRPQDTTYRKILFYYNGGLEGNLEDGGPTFVPYVVKLFCPDPDWLSVDDQEILYPYTSMGGVTVPVTNLGDMHAYPIFTWNGPGSSLSIQNVTTGKQISLTNNGGLTISSSQTIIIDTRPATERTELPVIDTYKNNYYSYVSAGSDLNMWLAPGLNQLYISASGLSSASSLNLRYTERYRGVLR